MWRPNKNLTAPMSTRSIGRPTFFVSPSIEAKKSISLDIPLVLEPLVNRSFINAYRLSMYSSTGRVGTPPDCYVYQFFQHDHSAFQRERTATDRHLESTSLQ